MPENPKDSLILSGSILKTTVAKSGKVINSVLVGDLVLKFLTDTIKYKPGEAVSQICINAFAVDGGFLGSEA